MKYFKLGFNMLIHKTMFNILIILEIAAMLVLTNIVISSYNGKDFLYEPYKKLLNNNGVVCEMDLSMGYGNNNEDIRKIIEKYNYLDFSALISLLKERLSGNIDIIFDRYYWLSPENGGPHPKSSLYQNVQMIGVDPYIYSNLRLPLSEGRWADTDITSDGIAEAIISGGTSAELGQIYETDVGKIRIVGILTDSNYVPPGINLSESVNKKLSIFDYYQAYDCNLSMRAPFILMNRTVYDKLISEDDPNYGSYFFISYGKTDDETAEKNTDYLCSIGGRIRNQFGEENFYTINAETKKELDNIYLRMLPLIIVSFVIVLAGLTGSMSMSVTRGIRTYGIFYLCGCNWKKCRRILSVQIILIIFLSTIITFITLFVMKIINIEYMIGSVYRLNNVYISLIEMILIYILSLIIPKSLIRYASPVETIRYL